MLNGLCIGVVINNIFLTNNLRFILSLSLTYVRFLSLIMFYKVGPYNYQALFYNSLIESSFILNA